MKKERLFLLLILLGLLAATTQLVSAQQTNKPKSTDVDASVDCRVPVTVVGAVVSPSRFELHRKLRLREVIALAGGVTERAKGTIQILHADLNPACESVSAINNQTAFGGQNPQAFTETYNVNDVFHGDEKANPYMRPGDVITVLELGLVRVVGKVKNPKAILFNHEMTLTQAIALAGGVLPDSQISRVMVMRANHKDATKSQIGVNLKAIEQHRATDLPLFPNDIVYVPSKKGGVGCCSGEHFLIVDLTINQLPLRVIE